MRMWLRNLTALTSVALLAAACTEAEEPAEPIPVTVYFQGPLTGDFNYLVIHAFQAAQLRFDELNASPDFPAVVSLELADTQGDPEQAVSVADTVVADPNVVAVEGPTFLGESEASGDTYNAAGIPFLSPTATSPSLAEKGWEFWYRGIANYQDQAAPAGQYIVRTLGAENVYVAHDKSEYGEALAEVVSATVEGAGAEVPIIDAIEPTEDYSAFLRDVETSGADALFYGGYDAQTGLIVVQAREGGLDIPIISGDESVSSRLLELAGESLTDVHLTCPCNLEGPTDFLAKYEAEYGEIDVPIYAAEGYDVASLIGEGIRSAIDGGAQAPEQIRTGIKDYLDSLTPENPFEGVAKTYSFDERHEPASEDRTELIFVYETAPGELSFLGTATDVLDGAG